MSHKDAIEDKIRFTVQANGCNWYFPLCASCGKEVPNWGYIRGKNYLCKECKTEKALIDKQTSCEESAELKEKKFKNAVERILKVIKLKDEDKYVTAAEKIHNNLHKAGWFDSTEEIMVAIELLKNGIKTRHQVKFGNRYRADFVLLELKVVLEVDGVCFHNERTKQKEELRDSLILASLGAEWEVIRITDELINKNITKLLPAIKSIVSERKKVREKNNGLLPYWYTDRKLA